MASDLEFRASYSGRMGCHIVIIEQFDVSNPAKPNWRTITNLFCSSREIADHMIAAINAPFVKGEDNGKAD